MLTKKDVRDPLLFLAWAVSATALFGSLFFSEVLKYEPCTLCWYERMALYPLFILLGIAIIRKDYFISLYSMVFSIIGAALSLYHYGNQKLPALQGSSLACGRTPCTDEYINWFGFITIPFLAFIAFLLIPCLTFLFPEVYILDKSF